MFHIKTNTFERLKYFRDKLYVNVYCSEYNHTPYSLDGILPLQTNKIKFQTRRRNLSLQIYLIHDILFYLFHPVNSLFPAPLYVSLRTEV